MITATGHVALQVPDVENCVSQATSLLGLRSTEQVQPFAEAPAARP